MPTSRKDPYAEYSFLLGSDDGQGQGKLARILGGFSEVTGLGMDVNLADYRNADERFDHARRFVGTHKSGVVTLKRGVIADADLSKWIGTLGDGVAHPRRLQVTMLDASRNPVATFTLHNTLPIKCVSSTLGAVGEGVVAVEELSLSHEGIEHT